MTYKEAIQLKEKKEYLRGKTDEKGFTIGDLVIVPVNKDAQVRFLRNYIFNHNYINSEVMNGEVQLWGIDIERLDKSGVLFYQIIKD